jgi:hypothetical protein
MKNSPRFTTRSLILLADLSVLVMLALAACALTLRMRNFRRPTE